MSLSFTRALIAANSEAFDAYLVDESVDVQPRGFGPGRTLVRVKFEIACTPEHLEAAQAIKKSGLPRASAATPPEPAPRPSVRRNDITLTPRFVDTSTFDGPDDRVAGWEASLSGRLSTGEGVTLSATGTTSAAALARLTERIDAEGWQIEEPNEALRKLLASAQGEVYSGTPDFLGSGR